MLHNTAGSKVPLYNMVNIFVVRVSLVPPNEIQRNMNDKAAVLGELGFRRGEY